MSKSRKHVHKYHLVDLNGIKVWACALPTCYHYMPKHMESMVPGRSSICWGCDGTFILNAENMKSEKPVCDNCNPEKKKLMELLNEI